jgi:hypothetical protein
MHCEPASRPALIAALNGSATEIVHAIQEAAAPAQRREEQLPMSHSANKTRIKISQEIRDAVLAASPSESNIALGAKLGISEYHVRTIRAKAGI